MEPLVEPKELVEQRILNLKDVQIIAKAMKEVTEVARKLNKNPEYVKSSATLTAEFMERIRPKFLFSHSLKGGVFMTLDLEGCSNTFNEFCFSFVTVSCTQGWQILISENYTVSTNYATVRVNAQKFLELADDNCALTFGELKEYLHTCDWLVEKTPIFIDLANKTCLPVHKVIMSDGGQLIFKLE